MPVTYTQARDALVARVVSVLQVNAPTLPVIWDNAPAVDITSIGPSFVQVEVGFDDVDLATAGDDLVDHVMGTVGFRVFQKEFEGTRPVFVLMDVLNTQLRHLNVSGIATGSPYPGRREDRDGWLSFEFLLPFQYYTV